MNILDEAKKIIETDRQADYGPPKDNWGRTAKIWSGILGTEVTPEQAVLCMVGVKLAREGFKHKRDNLVDAAGYLGIAEKLLETEGVWDPKNVIGRSAGFGVASGVTPPSEGNRVFKDDERVVKSDN